MMHMQRHDGHMAQGNMAHAIMPTTGYKVGDQCGPHTYRDRLSARRPSMQGARGDSGPIICL